MQLRLLERRMEGDPALARQFTAVRDELGRSLEELRELARGIHPAVLEHGLGPALDSLASRSPATTVVSYEAAERLDQPVELALYFVASEALANVAKYAAATAVSVRVWSSGARRDRDRRRRHRRRRSRPRVGAARARRPRFRARWKHGA